MNLFNKLDISFFYLLNSNLSNPVLDIIMPFVTELHNWMIPIGLFTVYLIVRGGKKGRYALLLMIPVILFCDQISAQLIKPWIAKIRPCHEYENVRLLVGCGGKFAFPSSHATNIAGFATLFALFYRRHWYIFAFLAGLIGYSRIYVGKHYPADVLGGILLGSLITIFVYAVFRGIDKKYNLLGHNE